MLKNKLNQEPELSKQASGNSIGTQGQHSVGSMKIGGLARRKYSKKVMLENAEGKVKVNIDSPRINLEDDKIINNHNIIINTGRSTRNEWFDKQSEVRGERTQETPIV